MTSEVAELLAENNGEIRDNYSGRCMYGAQTFAVVYDDGSQFQEAILDAAFRLGQDADDDHDAYDKLMQLREIRTDNMGLGIVVY
jgi:hypothetical protein